MKRSDPIYICMKCMSFDLHRDVEGTEFINLGGCGSEIYEQEIDPTSSLRCSYFDTNTDIYEFIIEHKHARNIIYRLREMADNIWRFRSTYKIKKNMPCWKKEREPEFRRGMAYLQFKLLRYLMKLTLKGIVNWKDMNNNEIIKYMRNAGYSNSVITLYLL